MNAADFLNSLGDDAEKWAKAFIEQFNGHPLDEDMVRSWFANAIEHSYDIRTRAVINGDHLEYLLHQEKYKNE